MKKNNSLLLFALFISLVLQSCGGNPLPNWKKKLNIKQLFSRLKKEKVLHPSDTSNLFDNDNYDPSKIDSVEMNENLKSMYASDSALIVKTDESKKMQLAKPIDSLIKDTIAVVQDSFTNDIKKINKSEVTALKYNLDQLKEKIITASVDSVATKEKCKLWADVSKKDQRLYLYVDGECVDTFKVSTGDKKHETPIFNRRPSGPSFAKYTSKKYPGGNWNGLGNMPYVVFIQGGYAIHGTTIGNIKRLGNKASHGCVRVHPDNAKVFFELVKAAGIENTWVTIR